MGISWVYKQRQSCWAIYTLELVCNHYDTETPNKCYEHEPLPVVDTPKETVLWDCPIRTDKTIQAKRPDIVLKHKQNKMWQLADMGMPSDRNISAKEF